MYKLLGISLVLAALLTVNALASMASAAIWRLLENRLLRRSARARAEILFAIRIGPPLIALVSVAAFLIPSYLTYEPYSTNEVVSKKLAALAGISAVGLMLALWRSVRSWLATRSLLKEWLRVAVPIERAEIPIPTFRIRHSFPILAVVGTLRPRLFIAEQVLQSLSAKELAAAIAHESGHLAARDNFKRSLLRACCDALLIIPCGRTLDRAWAEASECAADEYAAQESPTVALNLASALVRIAKMVPEGARAAMPMAAFLVGNEERGVKARVRRLLEIASTDQPCPARGVFSIALMPWTAVTFLVLLGVTVDIYPQVLAAVHSFIERTVSLLT
jgi:beta-lactamase regulating signal transducer with metallopeptidase domain